jgi:oxygen-independent coproporphyrinogen III oxidase
MDLEALLAKYDRRVPRYTSYPTAPHFTPAVDASRYAAWLRELPRDAELSLYLHVPFCAALCLFCGCHTTVQRRPDVLATYGRTLIAEIDLVMAAIGRRPRVRHIHWGGGTPTILPPVWLAAVMQQLRERCEVLPDAEVAVEIDPRALSGAALDGLAAIGVNRASLGVQDFDPLVQRTVQRMQPFETTAECAARLRRLGIGSINLDLLYGLPHQTMSGVAETVTQALTLAPDRVAMFGYAHVPWLKKQQALLPEAALPGPAERFRQRRAADAVITGAGYQAIGLDHFARPGDRLAAAARDGAVRRNFQGYTADGSEVLLGFGASSIGALPDGYVQNAPGVPAWRDAVRAGLLPTARGVALTPDDRLRRTVIERLMCRFEVDLAEAAASQDRDPNELMDAAPTLHEMSDDGLVQWHGSRLSVTEHGRPFVRTVAAAFDRYLQPGAARHASAV